MPSYSGRNAIRGGFATLLALAALIAVPTAAHAVTVTVNTVADNAPAPGQCEGAAGDCSLRQAIDVANGEPGPDTIVLPAGAYDLTIEPAAGTPNDSGDLNVLGSLTVIGAGARRSVIDAGAIKDRVLELGTGGSLDLVDLAVTHGRTSKDGGGIYAPSGDLTLEGVTVTENESIEKGSGGGISLRAGNLTIVDSLLSNNRNSGDGGGVFAEPGTLRIENSTFTGNAVDTSLYPTEPGWSPFGGAFEAFGTLLVMNNVTIAGNRIVNAGGSEDGQGAAIDAEFTSYEIANTIIADNTAIGVEETRQCTVTFGSSGHNLETAPPTGEPRCFEAPSDLIADPRLEPLADNGGETDTMALPSGSPAIDAGDPALCLPTDQRGVARPQGNGCDIGAFEYVPLPPEPEVKPGVTPAPTPSLAPKAPLPTGSFSIKGMTRNLRNGTAQLTVKFTGTGQATLFGKNLRRIDKKVSTGTGKLAILPQGRLKKALNRTGKAQVKVTVSFKTAGNTVTRTKSVILRLQPAR